MDGRDNILLLCRAEYITEPLVSVKEKFTETKGSVIILSYIIVS